uniref:Uncharacterized protein n=1 Tax=Solanum tuberosum TaxID=4113 RepID=M1DN61_SOLTU
MTVYKKYTRERRGPSGQVRKSCAGAGKRTLQRRSRAAGHLRNSFNRKIHRDDEEMEKTIRKVKKGETRNLLMVSARAHKRPLLNPARNPPSPPECTYTIKNKDDQDQT